MGQRGPEAFKDYKERRVLLDRRAQRGPGGCRAKWGIKAYRESPDIRERRER